MKKAIFFMAVLAISAIAENVTINFKKLGYDITVQVIEWDTPGGGNSHPFPPQWHARVVVFFKKADMFFEENLFNYHSSDMLNKKSIDSLFIDSSQVRDIYISFCFKNKKEYKKQLVDFIPIAKNSIYFSPEDLVAFIYGENNVDSLRAGDRFLEIGEKIKHFQPIGDTTTDTLIVEAVSGKKFITVKSTLDAKWIGRADKNNKKSIFNGLYYNQVLGVLHAFDYNGEYFYSQYRNQPPEALEFSLEEDSLMVSFKYYEGVYFSKIFGEVVVMKNINYFYDCLCLDRRNRKNVVKIKQGNSHFPKMKKKKEKSTGGCYDPLGRKFPGENIRHFSNGLYFSKTGKKILKLKGHHYTSE